MYVVLRKFKKYYIYMLLGKYLKGLKKIPQRVRVYMYVSISAVLVETQNPNQFLHCQYV